MDLLKDNFEIRDYIRILIRRKWYFLLGLMIVLGAGAFKILTRVPTYESSCVIQINPISRSSSLKRVMPGVTNDNMYRSLAPKMLYSEYLTQLIDSLNLRQHKQFRKAALELKQSLPEHTINEVIDILLIKKLKKMIRIRILGINTIKVQAEASTPDFAHQLVNTLIKIFIEAYIEREIALIKSTMQFNYEQINEFRKKIEQAERKLNLYHRKNIMDDEGYEVLNIDAADRINEAIVAIDLTMKGKRDYLNYLNMQLNMKETDGGYPDSPPIRNTFLEIDIKIDQMAELLKRYVWNSSELIKVNRDINLLRESIKKEIEKFYREKFSNLEDKIYSLLLDRSITLIDLEIANRKKVVLISILDSSKFSVSETQNRQAELARLEQEVASNQSIYNLFIEQSKGIQIEEAIQHAYASNRFQVLESPVKSIEPSNMSLTVLVSMILICATFAGMGLVFLRDFLDRSIRTVEEAENYFNLQVIGVIPYLDNEPFVDPKLLDHNIKKRGETWLNQLVIKNIIRTEGVRSENITETHLV